MKKFYDGSLPVSKAHVDRFEARARTGAGHGRECAGYHARSMRSGVRGISLNSKTGASTIASGESVSWLVGQLTVDQRDVIFASAVWRPSGGVDTLDATRLAIKTFVDRGVLRPRR